MSLFALAAVEGSRALFSGLSARRAAKRAKAREARRQMFAEAERKANNDIAGAAASLDTFRRTENNRRAGEALDKNRAAAIKAIMIEARQVTAQSVTAQLAMSRQRGEVMARAGASGLSGNAFDRMDAVLELQGDLARQAADSTIAATLDSRFDQLANNQIEHLLGLDLGFSTPTLQTLPVEANQVEVPSIGSILLSAGLSATASAISHRNYGTPTKGG